MVRCSIRYPLKGRGPSTEGHSEGAVVYLSFFESRFSHDPRVEGPAGLESCRESDLQHPNYC